MNKVLLLTTNYNKLYCAIDKQTRIAGRSCGELLETTLSDLAFAIVVNYRILNFRKNRFMDSGDIDDSACAH